MVGKQYVALAVRQRRDGHRTALAGPRKVDVIDRFERSVAVDAREPFSGCGVADRGADVGADDMAAEQADRRIIGDRDDIVGDAAERILFLIAPTREIGGAKGRDGGWFGDPRGAQMGRASVGERVGRYVET